ncbi:alpha/beta-hydrolase [Clavulina sp. PMI_390]|nr:alpha/beta-hydrolase [Clavulina sp. PMI_390]
MSGSAGGLVAPAEPLKAAALPNGHDENKIHERLKELLHREVTGLAQNPINKLTAFASTRYFARVLLDTTRYAIWFFQTWVEFGVTVTFGGLGWYDLLTVYFYTFGGTIVLLACLIFCITVNSPFWNWARRHLGGSRHENIDDDDLFDSMTDHQVEVAKDFLCHDIKDSKDKDHKRHFNYDASKLLLQFAAIMYEHRNESIRSAIEAQNQGIGCSTVLVPSDSPQNPALNHEAKAALLDNGSHTVRKFCKKYHMDFELLSQLHDTSSACAGVFWDPKSNWIVITFKGTSPIEFGELLSDFDAKMVSAGSNIPGFKKVHRGFLERVYPEDVTKTGGVRPYDTILKGVRSLAMWLRKNNGVKGCPKINIWFTGHSLGCATASLVYSRMLMRPKDLGEDAILRDAYMFAAPILTDRDSVDVFNSKMLEDPEEPRTMWRITSNWDAVATLLPALGDYRSIPISPNNAFGFAHLGTELKLRDHPKVPMASGSHLYHGVEIVMHSHYGLDELLEQRESAMNKEGEKNRIWWARFWQTIPYLGRVYAHTTPNYWDQLGRIGMEGKAEWVKPSYFWW